MSRRRYDYVENELYRPFRERQNPNRNRKWGMELMYSRILTEIAINRFRWSGMPKTVDLRFLELTLHMQGLVIFYYDEQYDRHFALQGTGMGKVNMYQNPTRFKVIGNTMVNKELGPKECVPIWPNFLRIPDSDVVPIYASKLAETDRTIEITLKNLRMPFVFAVDDTQRLSMINMMRKIDEGEPAIFGTPLMTENVTEKINMFDVGQDSKILTDLFVAKSRLWNEAMTLLGVNNSNQDKKERLVSDEVSANDDQVQAVRNTSLDARQYAAVQINRMFDLDVSVDWNTTALTHPTPGTTSSQLYLSDGSDSSEEDNSDA